MQYLQQEQEEALKRRDLSALTNIINSGFDVNLLVIPKNTDVLLAAINKENKTVFNSVLERGFKCKNNHGFLYLHHAIRTNDIFFVKRIIEKYKIEGINFNEYSSSKDNCLHIAAGELNMSDEIISYLSEQGIKWTEQNVEGQTPLHIILKTKEEISFNILKILEVQKHIFNIKDSNSMSALDLIKLFSFSGEWRQNNNDLLAWIEKEFQ